METRRTSSLEQTLHDGALYERAPAYLREQVRAGLRDDTARTEPRGGWRDALRGPRGGGGFRLPWIGGGVVGMAFGALLASLVLLALPVLQHRGGGDGSDVAQEIVASHVRALMSDRAIDVVSTDQHTVKPWFNGRIDYAPPVVDPAAQGFPLVGGRLDYVDHRAVAVLIYRYLKHPIDLYVFPAARGASNPPAAPNAPTVTRSAEGYALVEWQHDGMIYWAVSDASPVYVEQFAEAIIHVGGK
ncbi:anti-sigma factor [Paraburkholderia sp.]|uniref:anti-sigma factor family protein n=1 Tax=Paraburkholderia sp. TaxID=1926495 RepID=UPI00238B9C7F|nr:anti-sigma factor [Paraburkholderia sp.]MDE1181014.1 anti-sigma factor [Paraburkholderia sp.]